MNLMFWKEKKDMAEDSEVDAQGVSDGIIESQKSPEGDLRRDELSGDTDAEAGDSSATRSTGLLIMGTVAGILVLIAAGFFAMKFFLSSHQKNHIPTNAQAAPQPTPPSENQRIKLPPIGFRQAEKVQPEDQPAKVDAPAKLDSKLQAQAVPQKNQQQPPVLSDTHKTDNNHGLSSTPNGDLVVGSKSPESTAIALKKMINIMNAGSDATPENAAR
jgi:flagellar basal body-associated protein FliL